MSRRFALGTLVCEEGERLGIAGLDLPVKDSPGWRYVCELRHSNGWTSSFARLGEGAPTLESFPKPATAAEDDRALETRWVEC
jgi:hypothetical protein